MRIWNSASLDRARPDAAPAIERALPTDHGGRRGRPAVVPSPAARSCASVSAWLPRIWSTDEIARPGLHFEHSEPRCFRQRPTRCPPVRWRSASRGRRPLARTAGVGTSAPASRSPVVPAFHHRDHTLGRGEQLCHGGQSAVGLAAERCRSAACTRSSRTPWARNRSASDGILSHLLSGPVITAPDVDGFRRWNPPAFSSIASRGPVTQGLASCMCSCRSMGQVDLQRADQGTEHRDRDPESPVEPPVPALHHRHHFHHSPAIPLPATVTAVAGVAPLPPLPPLVSAEAVLYPTVIGSTNAPATIMTLTD